MILLHECDLGGDEHISAAQASLCKRAATIEVQLEQLEAKFSEGEAEIASLDVYNRLAGNLRRLLETLGIERKARDVTDIESVMTRVRQRRGQ